MRRWQLTGLVVGAGVGRPPLVSPAPPVWVGPPPFAVGRPTPQVWPAPPVVVARPPVVVGPGWGPGPYWGVRRAYRPVRRAGWYRPAWGPRGA